MTWQDKLYEAEMLKRQCKPVPRQDRRLVNFFPTQPLCGSDLGDHLILILPPMYSRNRESGNAFARAHLRVHWANLAVLAWMQAGRKRWTRVVIQPTFCVPTKHRHDVDNYLGTQGWKGIQDGLTTRLYPDDDSAHVQIDRPCIEYSPRQPKTLLVIRPVDEAERVLSAEREGAEKCST